MNYISVREMESTVEDYIFDKKGIRVNINIQMILHPFIIQDQLNKLHVAYNIAIEYFKNKNK